MNHAGWDLKQRDVGGQKDSQNYKLQTQSMCEAFFAIKETEDNLLKKSVSYSAKQNTQLHLASLHNAARGAPSMATQHSLFIRSQDTLHNPRFFSDSSEGKEEGKCCRAGLDKSDQTELDTPYDL